MQSHENESEKKPQHPPQVVCATAKDGMEGVAFCVLQPVSAQAAIDFHVPDRRFDGTASPNIPFQPRGDAASKFTLVDLDSKPERLHRDSPGPQTLPSAAAVSGLLPDPQGQGNFADNEVK